MPPSPIPEALRTVPSLDVTIARLSAAAASPALSYASNPQRSPSPAESTSSCGTPAPSSRPPTLSPSPPPTHRQAISPNPSSVSSLLTDQSPSGISYPTPGNQSSRTALILNRFSLSSTIMYCSNEHLISSTKRSNIWEQRSFFDFVSPRDEDRVRSWIDTVKSWGVNERGQPSDGGFGFCKFGLVSGGRSTSRSPPSPRDRILRDRREQEPKPKSHRNPHSGGQGRRQSQAKNLNNNGVREVAALCHDEEIPVDAIFSAHSDGLMVILRRAT
ncbi:hypothetical protein V5O48_002126 [Marasmius crinis-equi]|uniref:Uncharacterized protein n=1 Tax=Marasmius crinis-equi TaxID=585013 RepID=A0ABR3FWH9_9AGAR